MIFPKLFGDELDLWRDLMVRVTSSFWKLRKTTKDRSSFDKGSKHSHINGWQASKCTNKCMDS
jgi:hypothetical protein